MEYIGVTLVIIAIGLCWDIVLNDGDSIANIIGTMKGKKKEDE